MLKQYYFIKKIVDNQGIILVSLFFILSVFIYKDYGLSWDEPCQQDFGELAYERIFEQKINPEYSPKKQNYGIAFEIVLVGIQKIFSITKTSDIYYFRHFFTHLIFLISGFVFYLILKKSTLKKAAILGLLFLIVSPRIYAHSFFNPKDIPLLSFTVFSIYFLQKYLYKPQLISLIIFAFFCAFVVNIRIIGMFIPGILMFFYFFQLREIRWKKKIQHGAIFSLSFIGFAILFWPLLWSNTVQSFSEAFSYFGKFYWNDLVIFRGEHIIASDLPWYYSIYYIFISVPVLYLLGFIGGLFLVLRRLINKKIEIETIIFLFLFFTPLTSLVVFESVVYDGWRHMFYIYPALIFFGLKLICFLVEKFQKTKVYFIVGVYLVFISWQMIQLHPYQNVYFNELVSNNNIREKYDLDYWGISFKEGINYVLEDSKKEKIKVCVSNKSGEFNGLLFSEIDKKRIEFVGIPEESDYFITNYRFHPLTYSFPNSVYSVKRNNAKILTIFKMN